MLVPHSLWQLQAGHSVPVRARRCGAARASGHVPPAALHEACGHGGLQRGQPLQVCTQQGGAPPFPRRGGAAWEPGATHIGQPVPKVFIVSAAVGYVATACVRSEVPRFPLSPRGAGSHSGQLADAQRCERVLWHAGLLPHRHGRWRRCARLAPGEEQRHTRWEAACLGSGCRHRRISAPWLAGGPSRHWCGSLCEELICALWDVWKRCKIGQGTSQGTISPSILYRPMAKIT
mmetsp:Transcript_98600/g.274353  ORF Transcript_98600/g.274353 Transcript_98600/m.274353 type:complete len:233 (+) Transcript_98600:103-801(+)